MSSTYRSGRRGLRDETGDALVALGADAVGQLSEVRDPTVFFQSAETFPQVVREYVRGAGAVERCTT
jgi:hypothetical protein